MFACVEEVYKQHETFLNQLHVYYTRHWISTNLNSVRISLIFLFWIYVLACWVENGLWITTQKDCSVQHHWPFQEKRSNNPSRLRRVGNTSSCRTDDETSITQSYICISICVGDINLVRCVPIINMFT